MMPEIDTILLLLALGAFVVAGYDAGRKKPPHVWNLLMAAGLALFIISVLL